MLLLWQKGILFEQLSEPSPASIAVEHLNPKNRISGNTEDSLKLPSENTCAVATRAALLEVPSQCKMTVLFCCKLFNLESRNF